MVVFLKVSEERNVPREIIEYHGHRHIIQPADLPYEADLRFSEFIKPGKEH